MCSPVPQAAEDVKCFFVTVVRHEMSLVCGLLKSGNNDHIGRLLYRGHVHLHDVLCNKGIVLTGFSIKIFLVLLFAI